MLPKDYLCYRLTGEFSTDVSDAAGMLLLDVKNRKFMNCDDVTCMSFISYLLNGLSLGSVYAIIALGYTMVL